MFSQCKEVIAHGMEGGLHNVCNVSIELNRVGLLLGQSKFVISAAKMSQIADNVLPYVCFQAISWYQHIQKTNTRRFSG